MEELVQKALEFVTRTAGDIVQDLAGQAGQALVNLVSDRLANRPEGARALLRLHRDPGNELHHRDAATALQAEAEADPDFARQLQEALSAALAERAAKEGTAGGFSFGSNISGNNAQVVGGHIVSGHMAGRDVNQKNIKKTKFGGMGWPAWVVVGVLLAGGVGAGLLFRDGGTPISRIGADPGESGVRETWTASVKAIRHADASTYCSLLTPTYKALFQQKLNDDCEASARDQWKNTDSASFAEVDSVTVKDVKVKGPIAEVAVALPEQSEPDYFYLERYGDRWRLTEKLAYAVFHPEDCPELNWDNFSHRDPRCEAKSL